MVCCRVVACTCTRNAARVTRQVGCLLACLARNSKLPYADEETAAEGLLSRVMRGEILPAAPRSVLDGVISGCASFEAASRLKAAQLAVQLAALCTDGLE